ncbi:MAG: PD40 domain-containing protein [Verrucomicrobiales bacterium]|nr:PD40 domain-containing protein [Verrucomicrobiales bacterium]
MRGPAPSFLLWIGIGLVAAGSVTAQENANGAVRNPSLSDDGRFVAFDTRATNLIAGSGLLQDNVGFFDRETRVIYNAQRSGPKTYWGAALFPQMSNDGEWMTFQSGNFFLPDRISTDIYVCAVRSQTLGIAPPSRFRRISRNAAWEPGNDVSNYPTISANGRFIAYMSKASNLTDDLVPDGVTQIYRHDRDADENGLFDEDGAGATRTVLVSQVDGVPGDADSTFPTISADGSRILFVTKATNFPTKYSSTMIWIAGTISATTGSRRGISPEGTLTLTRSAIYPAGDPTANGARYRYRNWETLELVGFPDYGAGNIASSGAASVLNATTHPIPPVTDSEVRHVYLFDRVHQRTVLLSQGPNGPGNDDSGPSDDNDAYLDLSRDGRFAAFVTRADNLGFEDTNNTFDVIIRDLQTGEADRVERDSTPPDWPNPGFAVSQVTDQTALFSWNPASDRGGVRWYRIDLEPTLSRSSGPATRFQVTGLHPGTTYTAEIFAIDPSGNETSGGTVSFPTQPDSGAHPGFAITGFSISPQSIDVSFRSEAGRRYRLESSANGRDWVPLKIGIESGGGFTSDSVDTPEVIDTALLLRLVEE